MFFPQLLWALSLEPRSSTQRRRGVKPTLGDTEAMLSRRRRVAFLMGNCHGRSLQGGDREPVKKLALAVAQVSLLRPGIL